MTFNTNSPNASLSPGLFPVQAGVNLTRLQQIIQNDHQFNNTQPSPAPGNDGCHLKVSYINRAAPTGALPVGVNLISFSQNASDSLADLWAYDGSNPAYQYSWRELTGGPIAINSSVFTPVLTVPTNSFGTIYMLVNITVASVTTPYIQMGYFISNTTISNVYAITTTQVFSPSPVLSFSSSGLGVVAQAAFNRGGDYTYKVEYRKYA